MTFPTLFLVTFWTNILAALTDYLIILLENDITIIAKHSARKSAVIFSGVKLQRMQDYHYKHYLTLKLLDVDSYSVFSVSERLVINFSRIL